MFDEEVIFFMLSILLLLTVLMLIYLIYKSKTLLVAATEENNSLAEKLLKIEISNKRIVEEQSLNKQLSELTVRYRFGRRRTGGVPLC